MKRKLIRKHSPVKRDSAKSAPPFLKLGLTAVLLYAAYLIVLPLIAAVFVPCLGNHPFVSYADKACTVTLALDRFMQLALIGFGVLTIGLWFILKRYSDDVKNNQSLRIMKKRLTSVLLTSVIMAASLITAYLLFLPSAVNAVRTAPIMLESMKK
jgi:hypothetical protein